MFTGIVREIGRVEEVERSEGGASLRVRAGIAAELAAGDSVSVGGACLTVSSTSDGAFEADVMNQTLSLTTLGGLEAGASVNLEPPLRAGDPIGGHLVQGHVDGTGEVRQVSETLDRTTLGELAERSRVNLEVDVIARYAERLMQGFETKEGE